MLDKAHPQSTAIKFIVVHFFVKEKNSWSVRNKKASNSIVPGWISAFQGTVDRGITASQEEWDGHFFVGMALFRQVYQRAKSPQLNYNIDC